ncbi:response regulator [Fulvivirga ligni]|uniref:response regulator n=1 Tax=Fulvivirga ligni TaxID=2904246 RepID=UPI001F1B78B3|nr:response regulator [Fulvivirga ligni]UII21347.1 response regulator [Fulvivirga ligni]
MVQTTVDYKNFLNSVNAFIYGVDETGSIIFSNTAFQELVAIEEEKLEGMKFYDLAVNSNEVKNKFKEQTQASTAQATYQLQLKNDPSLVFNQTVSEVKNDKDSKYWSVIGESSAMASPLNQAMSYTNSILDSMSESVIVYDKNMDLLMMNAAGKKLLGIDPEVALEDILLDGIVCYEADKKTIVPTDNYPRNRVLKGEYLDDIEMYVHNKTTNTGVFINVNGRPIHDENNDITGAIIVANNITTRKISEFETRKQSEILDQSQKMAQIGHWEVDLKTNKIFWSSETKKIHEVDKDYEPELETAINFYDQDSRPIIIDTLNRCQKTGESWDLKLGIITGKGNYKYVRTIGKVEMEDNVATKLYGVFQDISQDRKREEQLIAFVDAAPAAIAMFDDNIRYIAASDKWYKNYKLEGKEIIGISHYEVFPEIGQEWKDIHQRVLKGEICKNEEDRFERLDHTVQWLKWEVRPWYELSGNIGGIIMLTEDITLEKQAKEELRKAKEAAEAAADAKEEFLSTMSHEIRTPMNAVIGMTHLLLQEEKLPHQEENLKTLQFSAENLLVLINDILDFNKISAGKINLEKVPFRLRELANNIRKSFQFKTQEKQIRLSFIYDSDIPELLIGDTTRINQILVNLVGNAVKFTNEGVVKLTIQLKAETEESALVSFSVKDTGIGIPKEYQANIFERFAQAGKETTRKFGGTGLGLAITKKLLELHHSDITLKSEKGKGSEFLFDIKFKKADAKYENTHIAPIVDHKEHQLDNVKILLVEDNQVNQLIACKFLENWNIEVEVADDGQIALEKLLLNSYDLVLMDLQMPVMDGYEATRQIRKNSAFDDLPIIALTADATTNIKERVLEVGMNDFLTKPINPDEMKSKIVNYTLGKTEASQPISKKEKENPMEEISFKMITQMANNDSNFIISLIESFQRELASFTSDFEVAAKNQKVQDMKNLIHKMKPSFELFSLNEYHNQLNTLTDKVNNGRTDITSHLQEIESRSEAIMDALNNKANTIKQSV